MSGHHALPTLGIVGPVTSALDVAEQPLVWLRAWRMVSDGEQNLYLFGLGPKTLPALSRSSA